MGKQKFYGFHVADIKLITSLKLANG